MWALTPSAATSPRSRLKFAGSFSIIAESDNDVTLCGPVTTGVVAGETGEAGVEESAAVSRENVLVLNPPRGRIGGIGRTGQEAVGSWGMDFSLMPNIFFMLRNMLMNDYGTVIKQDCDTTGEKRSSRVFPLKFAQVNAGVMILLVRSMILTGFFNILQFSHWQIPCHRRTHCLRVSLKNQPRRYALQCKDLRIALACSTARFDSLNIK